MILLGACFLSYSYAAARAGTLYEKEEWKCKACSSCATCCFCFHCLLVFLSTTPDFLLLVVCSIQRIGNCFVDHWEVQLFDSVLERIIGWQRIKMPPSINSLANLHLTYCLTLFTFLHSVNPPLFEMGELPISFSFWYLEVLLIQANYLIAKAPRVPQKESQFHSNPEPKSLF